MKEENIRTRFISLEGSEGCGKSTQITRLQTRLQKMGFRAIATREPGGTPLGESLRQLLKHAREGQDMCPETELLLFTASRAQLSRAIIAPALEEGSWVLADRYGDSTTVYQGVARKLEIEQVNAINQFAMGDLLPGLTIILDLGAAELSRRLMRRPRPVGEEYDRMEEESASFFDRVREGYRELAKREPDRVRLLAVDSLSPDQVEDEIWKLVSHAFSL